MPATSLRTFKPTLWAPQTTKRVYQRVGNGCQVRRDFVTRAWYKKVSQKHGGFQNTPWNSPRLMPDAPSALDYSKGTWINTTSNEKKNMVKTYKQFIKVTVCKKLQIKAEAPEIRSVMLVKLKSYKSKWTASPVKPITWIQCVNPVRPDPPIWTQW